MSDNPFVEDTASSDDSAERPQPNPQTGQHAGTLKVNPYAPTTQIPSEPIPKDDIEAYRQLYLNHEASVKSIGSLYLLGAIICIPTGVVMALTVANRNANLPAEMIGIGLFYTAIGITQMVVGLGLRNLKTWARWVAAVISLPGLAVIPIGTLISAIILYLLISKKSAIVFSSEYKDVIAQTPHIKYRTSIIVWVFATLLFAVISLGLVSLFFFA